MVPHLRQQFNQQFTPAKYEAFLEDLMSHHPGDIEFRVAETPVFVDKTFADMVMKACEDIVDVIVQPNFKAQSEAAIPEQYKMAGEGNNPEFICFDFGICVNEKGYLPQLIEMQGFPSLFAYQILHSKVTNKHFPFPTGYDSYLNGYEETTYISTLRELILGKYDAANVVLLEIYPDQQKTRIDFRCTKDYVGIETVCLTELKADGKKLYYEKSGNRVDVKRIYNRLIFDDLEQQQLPEGTIDITAGWEVEWCPHPHWFYRISKHTLPFIKSDYVPETKFLHEVDPIPDNLSDYVLKPLFSFAGQGVIIDLTKEDIEKINDKHNWILQKKVQYAEVIETPDIPAKAEIRVFYFWPEGAARPVPAQNLARLSKGKMIGVRYNKDKEWVGGSLVLFEKS